MQRRTFTTLVCTLITTIGFGLGGVAPVVADTSTDETAIREIWKKYSAARVAADADLYMSLWDENGIQMPSGKPMLDKAAMVASAPKKFIPGTVKSMNIYPKEIEVAGDWAYCWGTYDSARVAGGREVMIDGKFMTILKRQSDGSWKIFRDISNSNN